MEIKPTIQFVTENTVVTICQTQNNFKLFSRTVSRRVVKAVRHENYIPIHFDRAFYFKTL